MCADAENEDKGGERRRQSGAPELIFCQSDKPHSNTPILRPLEGGSRLPRGVFRPILGLVRATKYGRGADVKLYKMATPNDHLAMVTFGVMPL